MPMNPGEKAKALGLSAATIVVALLLTEGLLAVTGSFTPQPELYPGDRPAATGIQFDSHVGWRLPPGAEIPSRESAEFTAVYLADSLGFRRPPEAGRSRSGKRVVFIGDSFTFGQGVNYEETFAGLLERQLPDVTSHNFGMSGFGLDQMWQALHHYGLTVAPALVVVTFVDDDLRRSLTAYRRRGDGWWLKPTFRLMGDSLAPVERPGAIVRLVQEHSRLAQAWREASWRLSRDFAVGHTWRLNAAILRAIREDARGVGARLVVVRIPQRGRWQPALAMSRALAQEGFEFLDLATLLPPDPLDYYFKRDPHLNARGHMWVASSLRDFLSTRGLLAALGDGQSAAPEVPAPGTR